MIKRISAILISALLITSLISCGGDGKGFSHAELAVPLPDSFYETEEENFDAAFTDGESIVTIVRISFDAALAEGIVGSLTPTEFGRYWVKKCGRGVGIQHSNGVSYCVYRDGLGYFYLESFFRSEYAYFVVLFAGNEEREEILTTEFLSYASGIRLN